MSRKGSLVFGIAWVLVVTAEFWILGPYSFGSLLVEGNSLFVYMFLNERYDGSLFSHAFAGGNDVYGLTLITGSYVSLERFLLDVLPLPVAQFAHKVAVCAVGFWGTYLLCRRTGDSDRVTAAALAAIFTLTQQRLLLITWEHGLGFALVPMAVYLCVGRQKRRYYGLGIVVLACVNAVSSTPTHSNLALLAAVALGGLLFGFDRLVRVLPALFILVAVLLLNWHESIYAKALLAPYSYRGTSISYAQESLSALFQSAFSGANFFWGLAFQVGLGLGLLFLRRFVFFWWAAFVLGLGFCGGTLVQAFPWEAIGLGVLKGVHFSNMNASVYALSALVCAQGISARAKEIAAPVKVGRRNLAFVQLAAIFLLSLAVGKLAWYKAFNTANWLTEGGLPAYWGGMESLGTRPWLPNKPVRVASVPYRLPSNLAVAVGLDTADGVYHIQQSDYARFWLQAVPESSPEGGYVTLNIAGGDFKSGRKYDLSEEVNLDLLRVANVGFVLSVLPLSGEGTKQVAGPRDALLPTRNTEPLGQKLKGYLDLVFDPAPVLVYALLPPLPRVFVAKALKAVSDDTVDEAFFRIVAKEALARTAVVRTGQLPVEVGIGTGTGLRLLDYALVRDGFDLSVAASDVGVAVINTPYYPFWEASADGNRVRVFPVNGIHTAVAVPKGAREIKLRWRRPMLKNLIEN